MEDYKFLFKVVLIGNAGVGMIDKLTKIQFTLFEWIQCFIYR